MSQPESMRAHILAQMEDKLVPILVAREHGRIDAHVRRLPKELFDLAEVVHVLLAVVSAQQAEIETVKGEKDDGL